MLHEFRAENHRSVRDEQALSLVATGRLNPGDQVPRESGTSDHTVLPSVALYGANASGKSNVLSALVFMRDAVLYSHRFWSPGGGVPRTPFAWGNTSSKTSLFEVTFEDEDVEFNYGFAVSDAGIEEEWLKSRGPKARGVEFNREGNKFHLGKTIRKQMAEIEHMTRPNALLLSTAVQLGNEDLKSVYRFFSKISTFGKLSENRSSTFDDPRLLGLEWIPSRLFRSLESDDLSMFDEETDAVDKVRDLIRLADLGVVDVRREVSERKLSSGRTIKRNQFFLKHQQDDEESWLPLDQESDGTQMLFRAAPYLLNALSFGGLLLIDELESSLHPTLATSIVNMFNCNQANKRNAQLIFSTHDTNLLGTTVGAPTLRRDQVWFTEKDDTGASILYPLTNFKPRKAENIERGYLQGRYGAIPFLGAFHLREPNEFTESSQP